MPQPFEGPTLPLRAVALYDNNSESSEELSFKSGDILTVLEFNYSGFEGWWLCSFRGNQGICPGNRLKLLPHGEVEVQTTIKSFMPVDGGYVYDEPKGTSVGQQYDQVPPPVPAMPTESYDVPRPIKLPETQYEVPPSPVVAGEAYDIPRPPRLASNQSTDDSGLDVSGGEEYSVPRSDGSPLERLVQVEAEATSAVTAVLSLAVSGWRRADRIDAVAVESAVTRLDSAVNGLAAVAAAIAGSSTVPHSLAGKIASQASALSTGGCTVAAARKSLEASGWSVAMLSEKPGPATVSADPLGAAVSAAAALQQDIAAFASFIQGNASLLFSKEDNKKSENLAYVNIECHEGIPEDQDVTDSYIPQKINPQDLKILEVYSIHLRADLGEVGCMVAAFTDCVEQNQPPRVFINIVKQLLRAGGRAVCCGDAVSRTVGSRALAGEVSEASTRLADALGHASRATRDAAAQFPNIVTVQKMVNSIYAVSDHARRLGHAVVVH